MIAINISVRLTNVKFKSLWEKYYGRLSKNKDLEMQLMQDGTLIGIALDPSFRGSHHAGPCFSISFATFTFDITITDHRHWNYDTNDWETEEERRAWEIKHDEAVARRKAAQAVKNCIETQAQALEEEKKKDGPVTE
jgi:hypothetical protein